MHCNNNYHGLNNLFLNIDFLFYWNSSGGEVPATKLAALQKVLQSDFLNAVLEVYEHVYETVDVQVILYKLYVN